MHRLSLFLRNRISDIFRLFVVDWRGILKNKTRIAKEYSGYTEGDVNEWPYFHYEEIIMIINEFNEEERKERKRQEEQSSGAQKGINTSGFMNKMSNIIKK